MVVNYGKNQVARTISEGIALTSWRTVQFGANGASTAPTDTALKAPISGAAITASLVRTDNKLAFSGSWLNNTGAEQTVRELALADGSGMCARLCSADGEISDTVVPAGQTLHLDSYDLYVRDDSEV